MPGAFGWDVARLQFQLAWHGFPSGTMDGRFGALQGQAEDIPGRWGRPEAGSREVVR
jgi:hypothetical protein